MLHRRTRRSSDLVSVCVWSKSTTLTDTQNSPSFPVNTWFYAHAEQDWQEWRQVKNQLVSQKIAQQQIIKKGDKRSVTSLDKYWVWALLVLSMSMLWLERKLFKA